MAYPMIPTEVRPMVSDIDNATVGPSLSITPFHEINSIAGTRSDMTTARRFLHCVVKSALIKARNASEGFGIFVSIYNDLRTNRFSGKSNKNVFQCDLAFP